MKKLLGNGTILYVVTALLALSTAVVYALAKARENSPVIIGLLVAAAVLTLALVFVTKVPFLEYLPFTCVLVGLGIFIKLAFDEVCDILSKINMDGLSVSWIASAVLLAITVLVAAVSTVLTAKD